MNDFLQDVLSIKLSNKVPDRKIKKQSKISSVEFADGKEVAQGFGKRKPQGKPASDPQTFDKAKGEFADGEEVKVEDFKASSKRVKTSSDKDLYEEFEKEVLKRADEKYFDDFATGYGDYEDGEDFQSENLERYIEPALEAILDKHGIKPDKDTDYSDLPIYEELLDKILEKADNKIYAYWERVREEEEEDYDDEDSSKKVKNSSDDIKITDDELVLMNEDGKILSVVDDQHVDFLDTVDDPDGGYERAVKFDSYRDAHQALWNMYGEDIPEDIVTVRAKDAFAFVEDSECKKTKVSDSYKDDPYFEIGDKVRIYDNFNNEDKTIYTIVGIDKAESGENVYVVEDDMGNTLSETFWETELYSYDEDEDNDD